VKENRYTYIYTYIYNGTLSIKTYRKLRIKKYLPSFGIIYIFQSPEYIWSEEYQVKLLSRHFEAFDQLRNESFFIGEMIWNFADFNTAQSKYRVMIFRSVCEQELIW
jgi:hypothetical protein